MPIEHGSDSPAKRELIPNPKQGRGKGEQRLLEDSAHAVDAAAVSASEAASASRSIEFANVVTHESK